MSRYPHESLSDLIALETERYMEDRPLILGVDWVIPEFLRKDCDRDSEPGDEYNRG